MLVALTKKSDTKVGKKRMTMYFDVSIERGRQSINWKKKNSMKNTVLYRLTTTNDFMWSICISMRRTREKVNKNEGKNIQLNWTGRFFYIYMTRECEKKEKREQKQRWEKRQPGDWFYSVIFEFYFWIVLVCCSICWPFISEYRHHTQCRVRLLEIALQNAALLKALSLLEQTPKQRTIERENSEPVRGRERTWARI